MLVQTRVRARLIRPFSNSLLLLKIAKRLTYSWNFGSLLGIILIIQIISGLFLSFHYIPEINHSFNIIAYVIRDVRCGWLLRLIHANGARIFFIICYTHIGRGIFHSSFRLKGAWLRGSIIYILLIATAFLGYVLPWGQISLWGAIVITNLIRTIPIIGLTIVQWVWGGYRIGNATLNCFYSLHFLVPFLIIVIVVGHIVLLHSTGSSRSIGLITSLIKVKFDSSFIIKDGLNVVGLILFLVLLLWIPFIFIEAENFIKGNSLSSPVHIVPEWYFLFVYAILRSIPNKIGGVIILCLAIICLFIIILSNKNWKRSNYNWYKALFWLFVSIFFYLTWIGIQPVEAPYINLGQISAFIYFSIFFIEIRFNWFNNIVLH